MLIGALAQYFFGFTIFVLSSFLVLLVLVQRGRGGGLTGALGGPGGQSAFGTKAGDLFTRITIGVAAAWILLCATAVFMLRGRALPETGGVDRPAIKSDVNPSTGLTTSGTSGAGENVSALPKIDLPAGNSGATSPAAGVGTTAIETPATSTPATSTPGTESPAVEQPVQLPATPAVPVSDTPVSETPAANNSDAPATPPEPK